MLCPSSVDSKKLGWGVRLRGSERSSCWVGKLGSPPLHSGRWLGKRTGVVYVCVCLPLEAAEWPDQPRVACHINGEIMPRQGQHKRSSPGIESPLATVALGTESVVGQGCELASPGHEQPKTIDLSSVIMTASSEHSPRRHPFRQYSVLIHLQLWWSRQSFLECADLLLDPWSESVHHHGSTRTGFHATVSRKGLANNEPPGNTF